MPAADSHVDTLIVAGGSGVAAAAEDPSLLDWLRVRARHARRVASVCTGAFLLAEAGLLDGRRAATHWSDCAELAARYPKIRVEADPIFVRGRLGVDLRRHHRRHRPCAGPRRGRSRPRRGARRRALPRDVPQAPRRPGPVQHRPGAAGGGGALRRAARLDRRASRARPLAAGPRRAGRHERAQLQPALHRGHGPDPDARRGAASRRGGAAPARRGGASGQAHRRALRLRLRGDDAAQLPAPARRLPAGSTAPAGAEPPQ